MNLGFALEHSLGHTTHAQNLKRVLQDRPDITPTYVDLPYDGLTGAWTRLPGVRSNWSLRASLGAWLGLRRQAGRLDGTLFHRRCPIPRTASVPACHMPGGPGQKCMGS